MPCNFQYGEPGMRQEVPSFIDLNGFQRATYQNLYGAVKIAGCSAAWLPGIFTFRKRPYGKLSMTGDRFFRPLTKFRTAVPGSFPP